MIGGNVFCVADFFLIKIQLKLGEVRNLSWKAQLKLGRVQTIPSTKPLPQAYSGLSSAFIVVQQQQICFSPVPLNWQDALSLFLPSS